MMLSIVLMFVFLFIKSSITMDLRYLRQRPQPTTTVVPSIENCTQPVWEEWNEELPCNDDCGACGTRVIRRKCLTPECPCIGISRRQLSCQIKACEYPRPACCPPFKLTYYEGQFGCGPQDEEIVAEFLNKTTDILLNMNKIDRMTTERKIPTTMATIETTTELEELITFGEAELTK